MRLVGGVVVARKPGTGIDRMSRKHTNKRPRFLRPHPHFPIGVSASCMRAKNPQQQHINTERVCILRTHAY